MVTLSSTSKKSKSSDYPIVQNGILLVATALMLVSLLVDILYGVINPRIRHAS